jgi:DNA-directed RNA polymerase subunit RPC12/RpoP
MHVSEYRCKKCESHFEVLVVGGKDIECVECQGKNLSLVMCDKTQAGVLEFMLRRVQDCMELQQRVEDLEQVVFEPEEIPAAGEMN